ncbi:MAG: M15 family metallopeptidase, partial [Dehalococcoidia bacterium]|nr:M15 family metallopeptidase [Dehalococcoidia bacterium]
MSLDPRTYWTEQMEGAYGFMEELLAYPVQECGESLGCLCKQAREAGVEIVFAPDKKLGMLDRVFSVRESLVGKLLRVAESFLKRGWVLRIEDAYRTPKTQTRGACSEYVIRSVLAKVIWELDGGAPTAELVHRRLAVWTATTLKFANHTSGSAVDITVLRRDGSMLDLGGAYPQLSHLTPMASPFVSSQVQRNRQRVCELF